MSKPKLNKRHIEVAKEMIAMKPKIMFGMQWQNIHGFGVGNFPSLIEAGIVQAYDVGCAYGRKKYGIHPNAAQILKDMEA